MHNSHQLLKNRSFEGFSKVLMVMFILFATISMSAQINEQRIFLWDVSHSLVKMGLEKPLKEALITSIEAIDENGTDKIILVPFYNKPLQVIEVEATREGKEKLKEEITKRNIKESQISNTNIVEAINKFHELLKPEYRNYMFLYTDGKNENSAQQTDMDPLVNLLKKWGMKTKGQNCYGFYVLVHKAAEFPEIYDVERDNDNFFVVKDANVRIKILNLPPVSIFNARNENLLRIPVNGDLQHIGENVEVESFDSVYSIVSRGLKIGADGKTGVLELEISPIGEGPLPETHSLNFRPVIKGADDYTFITPKNPVIRTKYQKECTLSLTNGKSESNKLDLGECTYYPSFLWSEEKQEDVNVKMVLDFNKDSKDYNSRAILLFTDTKHNPLDLEKYEIFLNGEKLSQPEIPINTSLSQLDLSIRPLPSTTGGRTTGYMMLKPGHTLDRVNQVEVQNSQQPVELMQWQLKYHNNMNPWAKWLCIALGFIIAILLLWIMGLRQMFYPCIKKVSRIIISDPYYSNRKIKGAYKVVCTSRKCKQSLLSRIFKGKEIYEVNPVWTNDVVFRAAKKGVKVHLTQNYEIDPYSTTLMKNSEYKIKNNQNKEKISLTIM